VAPTQHSSCLAPHNTAQYDGTLPPSNKDHKKGCRFAEFSLRANRDDITDGRRYLCYPHRLVYRSDACYCAAFMTKMFSAVQYHQGYFFMYKIDQLSRFSDVSSAVSREVSPSTRLDGLLTLLTFGKFGKTLKEVIPGHTMMIYIQYYY
ncbi:unnamed protein product, partial [Meganyctiphanes norvegica]